MLVDKTNFGAVLYNPTNFYYRFEETSNYWSVKQLNEYQFFFAFHWSPSDTPPPESQCITVQ